jgi:hypothetical protein
VGGAAVLETMTVPKKQTTAAKKARAVQRQAGGKHTTLLAAQVCGEQLDPFLVLPETCTRPPHPRHEPCSPNRDFDIEAWKKRVAADWATEEARRAALTPEERAEEDERAREWEYDEMRAAADDGFDPYAKYYGDED